MRVYVRHDGEYEQRYVGGVYAYLHAAQGGDPSPDIEVHEIDDSRPDPIWVYTTEFGPDPAPREYGRYYFANAERHLTVTPVARADAPASSHEVLPDRLRFVSTDADYVSAAIHSHPPLHDWLMAFREAHKAD